MPIHNADIASAFAMIADLLEVEGANVFRVRAYRNAARTVDALGQDLAALVESGEDLTQLQGIGKDLAAKIEEMVATGKMEALEKLQKKLPADITRMLRLPGLGPKRVKTLYQDLQVKTLAQLEKAAREGLIRELPGLGAKMESQILEAVARAADASKRFLRASTAPYVESLVAYLSDVPGVKKVTTAGSYRRSRETVGDVDLLVVATRSSPVMDRFVAYDEVTETLAHGKTKSSIVLRSGLQVDLRVVEAKSYGSALHYFTGSKEHNIAIRRLAQKRGLKVNEYGLFKADHQVAGVSESELFEALGLTYIEPELRENRGEVNASSNETLPALIEPGDLRGDLHTHSRASDGKATIKEMADAARKKGYQYLAITDHSKHLTVANGLDEKRLLKQMDEIDRLNENVRGFTVLKGIEVDILDKGELDLSDEVLRRLDLVIGSVHSKFRLSREEQTERILRAMDHPYFTMLGHPTGRLLLSREPYEVDVERIIAHAKQRGCFLELNANPHRLDLNDVHCRMAKEAGVLIGIDTDAHSTRDLDLMPHGVGQARRGWLEKGDVLNTRTLKQLQKLLAGTRRD